MAEVTNETILDVFLHRHETQSYTGLGKSLFVSLVLHVAVFVAVWFYGQGLTKRIAQYSFLEVSLLEQEPRRTVSRQKAREKPKRVEPRKKSAVKETPKVQVEPPKIQEPKKVTSPKVTPKEPVLPKEVKPRVPKREKTEVRLAKAERPKSKKAPRPDPVRVAATARLPEQGRAPAPVEQDGDFGYLEVESKNLPRWYVEVIRERVRANWENLRALLPQGTYAKVVIRFEITRSGELRGAPEVFQTSNIRLLDQSGFRAVLRASPFPPLPQQFEEDILGVRCGFVCGAQAQS